MVDTIMIVFFFLAGCVISFLAGMIVTLWRDL